MCQIAHSKNAVSTTITRFSRYQIGQFVCVYMYVCLSTQQRCHTVPNIEVFALLLVG